jgi:hypothetical protein
LSAVLRTIAQVFKAVTAEFITTRCAVLRAIEDVLVAAAGLVSALSAVSRTGLGRFGFGALVITTIRRTISRTEFEGLAVVTKAVATDGITVSGAVCRRVIAVTLAIATYWGCVTIFCAVYRGLTLFAESIATFGPVENSPFIDTGKQTRIARRNLGFRCIVLFGDVVGEYGVVNDSYVVYGHRATHLANAHRPIVTGAVSVAQTS